ncbi:hypothetical protein H0H92_002461 [Tricholoma furcatifolium]|nr:hypothetical protein H0H92_002461 [Tricholoma furcatifolium]
MSAWNPHSIPASIPRVTKTSGDVELTVRGQAVTSGAGNDVDGQKRIVETLVFYESNMDTKNLWHDMVDLINFVKFLSSTDDKITGYWRWLHASFFWS